MFMLGALVVLMLFILILPINRGPTHRHYSPYYKHGGRSYKPGIVY